LSGQVGDLEAELFVDGCFHWWLGVVDDVAQVAEAGDEGADVVFGELAGRLVVVSAGGAGEHGSALGLDLAGPVGDGLGVGSGVERGLVAGESGVAAGDEGLAVLAGRHERSGTRVLGGLHLPDGVPLEY
jgi:hypothetical protein